MGLRRFGKRVNSINMGFELALIHPGSDLCQLLPLRVNEDIGGLHAVLRRSFGWGRPQNRDHDAARFQHLPGTLTHFSPQGVQDHIDIRYKLFKRALLVINELVNANFGQKLGIAS